jgi:hypothetical protein
LYVGIKLVDQRRYRQAGIDTPSLGEAHAQPEVIVVPDASNDIVRVRSSFTRRIGHATTITINPGSHTLRASVADSKVMPFLG